MRKRRNPLLKFQGAEQVDEYQVPGMTAPLKPAAKPMTIPLNRKTFRTLHRLPNTSLPNPLLSQFFKELTELDKNNFPQPTDTENKLPEWFTSINQQPRDKPKSNTQQLQEQLHTLNNEFTVDANKIRQEEELAFQRLQRLQLEEQHSKQAAKIYVQEDKRFKKIQQEFQGHELTEPQNNIIDLDNIVINYIIQKLQQKNQTQDADKIQGFLNKLNYQRRYAFSKEADTFRNHTILHLAQKKDSYLEYKMPEIFNIIVNNIEGLPNITDYLTIQCLCGTPGKLQTAAEKYDETHRHTTSDRASILKNLRKSSSSQETSLPTIPVRQQPINNTTDLPDQNKTATPLIIPHTRRRLKTHLSSTQKRYK